jgi:hypothetical protein
MITYTVKYKRPDDRLWSKIKGVKGDGFIPECAYRFFILEDEQRIEIPLGHLFKFSKERFTYTHKQMETEIGQKIPLKEE